MLIDTTLREGAQLFGAYFNIDTRKRIVSGLMALGVDEIELGWVGQDDLLELAEYARSLKGNAKLSVWSPCREADIIKVSMLPIDRINIGVPVSDLHIEKRLSTDRDGLLKKLTHTVKVALDNGIEYVSIGLEDLSRADEGFALTVALLAKISGASRVRLADSLGQLTPKTTEHLVQLFSSQINIDFAVHCHDDFGMATGNAVTALASGAKYVDVSVLGIGERAGIAATEELVAYLALKNDSHKYSTEALMDLCSFVSNAAGVPIARTKAVVGTDIFACESGLHAHALSKSPELFEPYNPERVGKTRKLAVGGKSGRAAVVSALSDCGLDSFIRDISGRDLSALTQAVRKLSCELERPLTKGELLNLTQSEN
ncbi:LeuA family protein [Maridesulfovibrio frigidus]|uniref:LeuA family protein n=1 Tax=Maridesulfovibrio frigidus TaxID=340956 RepID=UPI0004E1762B|nr:pyruvate carboxyltransferase [Maridesulfovibrio frigidus]